MRLTRVHVAAPLAGADSTLLEGDAANHVMRVLRLRVGDALTVFDGQGGEYAARVAGMRRGGVEVQLGGHRAIERESPLEVALLQSVARGERMDYIVQKTTELGVTRIVPIISERTVVRLEPGQGDRKVAHWRAVAVAACEQCGRNRVPEIALPVSLIDALDAIARNRAANADIAKLVLDPAADAALGNRIRGASKLALLVGPEGGLTENELELASRTGFQPYRLGPRILRAETAAVACLAAIQAIAGDLGT